MVLYLENNAAHEPSGEDGLICLTIRQLPFVGGQIVRRVWLKDGVPTEPPEHVISRVQNLEKEDVARLSQPSRPTNFISRMFARLKR